MSFAAIATALLLSASPASLSGDASQVSSAPEHVDVAYRELSAGQDEEALRRLEDCPEARAQDPAALINLAAAYAATGRSDKALIAYRAAIDSPDRYDLELADGTWMDSRAAARLAMNKLLNTNAMASR